MSLLAKYGKPAPSLKPREAGLGPVIDQVGNIRFLSVSQLEKFDSEVYGGCERRWWFRYKARQPEPQKGHQKLGDQAHAQLEHYLKTSEDVLGEIVRPGKRFLPAPGSDLLVEVKFGELAWPGPIPAPVISPLMAAGVPLTGKADLMHARGEWVDDDGVLHIEPDAAECLDHKTTKQIDDVIDPDTGIVTKQGYAKTAEQLADTWQMSGYGELAWQRWPNIKFARLGHAYYQTTGKRKASKRSILVPIDVVRARWKSADNLVERMKAVAREEKVENIAANIASCDAYGGCPHRQKCPRDPKLTLAAIFGANTAALLKKVAGDKSLSPSTASILDPSSSASSTAREEVQGMSLLAKRKAALAGQPAPAAAPASTVKPEVAKEMAALEAEEKAIRSGAAITPPDLPPPVKTAEPHAPESEFAKNIKVEASCGHSVSYDQTSRLPDGTIKHIGCTESVKAASPPPPTPASGACSVGGTQVELTIDEVASKKYACACGTGALKIKPAKLGDGKYYALVPKHDTPFANPPKVETPAPAPSTPPPAPVAPTVTIKPDASIEVKGEVESEIPPAYLLKSKTDERLDLYLDCAEDGVKLERLEKYADGLCQSLCEQYKAADVRCAPADSILGFGKWKGALAALAKAQPPAPAAYACSSTSEIGLVVFEALATLGRGRVVRGAR